MRAITTAQHRYYDTPIYLFWQQLFYRKTLYQWKHGERLY